MTIYPTHHCFDDALDWLMVRARAAKRSTTVRSLLLVHGIVRAPDGTRFAHAWVEEGALVWDSGVVDGRQIVYQAARAEYYSLGRIESVTRYTVRQALDENKRSGHYGPWVDAYRALCSTERRVFPTTRESTEAPS